MTKYLITFPADAMVATPEDMPAISADSHAVIEEAKAAGVYVFGGGINTDAAPVLVAADGSVSDDTTHLDGGVLVLELPSRDAALQWAAKIAVACRAPQELREFGYDAAS